MISFIKYACQIMPKGRLNVRFFEAIAKVHTQWHVNTYLTPVIASVPHGHCSSAPFVSIIAPGGEV
jgi:hypothetical protein